MVQRGENKEGEMAEQLFGRVCYASMAGLKGGAMEEQKGKKKYKKGLGLRNS